MKRQPAISAPLVAKGPDTIAQTMLAWGEGAHAILRTKKTSWPHHHLNAVVDGGKVRLFEGHYGYVHETLGAEFNRGRRSGDWAQGLLAAATVEGVIAQSSALGTHNFLFGLMAWALKPNYNHPSESIKHFLKDSHVN